MKRVVIRSLLVVGVLTGAVVLAACGGQDDDPDGAKALWTKINAGPGFVSWARAPTYPTRTESHTLHDRFVDIYVSKEMSAALVNPTLGVSTWPVGSVLVKDSYDGQTGDRTLVAVMERRADGWFWAEYDADGNTKYSGKPKICVDCHDNRATYSDWVYSFELPR